MQQRFQAQISNERLAEESRTVAKASRNPDFFFRQILGIESFTPDQQIVAASVRDHRRTLVTAGHGVGKTHLAARIALWFLTTFYNSKVITTAPTGRQVKNLLWKELRAAYQSATWPIGGHLNLTDLTFSDEWFALGISTDNVTNFQGYHAPFVLVIFDEATGVAPSIWEAAEGLAVGPNDRFLAIGNPTDPTSKFKAADDSGQWNVIRLSCENHPNVLERRQIIPGAVSWEWVQERLADYGHDRESALYRARVRGVWPDADDDTIIPMRLVEASNLRHAQIIEDNKPTGKTIALGVDVARHGADETVFAMIRSTGVVDPCVARRHKDTMSTVGEIVALVEERQIRVIAVDDSGVGGGVTDRLLELQRGKGRSALKAAKILAVNNGEKAENSDRFINVRAESYWWLRDALTEGTLHIPVDRKLEADLTKPKRQYDSHGRIKMESKDDLKKPERLGRSPDRGDALVLANIALRRSRIIQNVTSY